MKKAIKLIIIYYALQFVCLLPAVIYISIISDNNPEKAMAMPIMSVSLLISQLLMAWYLFGKKYTVAEKKEYRLPSLKLIPICIFLATGAGLFFGWLSELMNLTDFGKDMFNNMGQNVWGILSICLIGPVVEELMFRGAIMGNMLKIYKNPNTAILLSALVFGLFHGNPAQIPFAFLIGLILGFVYYRTGSLLPCIMIHVFNNSLSTVLSDLFPQDTTTAELFGSAEYAIVAISAVTMFVSIYMIQKMYPQPLAIKREE